MQLKWLFWCRGVFFASFTFLSYHHRHHFSWQLLFIILLMLSKSTECIGWAPTAIFLSQGATSDSEIPNWCSTQPLCFKHVRWMKWCKRLWSKSVGVWGLSLFFFFFLIYVFVLRKWSSGLLMWWTLISLLQALSFKS